MTPSPAIDRLTGALLLMITVPVVAAEWGGPAVFGHVAAVGVVLVTALLAFYVQWSRRIFMLVGLGLFLAALATRPDWRQITEAGLRSAAFIAAFFTALTTLRSASSSSQAIGLCGRFLAGQPPGRRYLALTVGGHLFGLTLGYGAISLLGGLAEQSARSEPNLEVRAHRIRRMLLAVQRGFVSTLPWSPLAFSMAISTSLVPGSSWGRAVGPCLVSGFLLISLGWALDTIFKPRLSRPAGPRPAPEGGWSSLWPLIGLLAILVLVVGGLHIATDIRAVGVVLPTAPLIAFAWIALQNTGQHPLRVVAQRGAAYLGKELPEFRSELALLIMAGFIGTLGARLTAPLVQASGFDLSSLPAWEILVALVWIIPLTGQLGMNPILSVSLMGPLIPDPAAMGVSPTAVIVAITGGWALSGASSPYTATTLLLGALGGVRAVDVGLRWNGLYTLLAGLLLSLWVALFAAL